MALSAKWFGFRSIRPSPELEDDKPEHQGGPGRPRVLGWYDCTHAANSLQFASWKQFDLRRELENKKHPSPKPEEYRRQKLRCKLRMPGPPRIPVGTPIGFAPISRRFGVMNRSSGSKRSHRWRMGSYWAIDERHTKAPWQSTSAFQFCQRVKTRLAYLVPGRSRPMVLGPQVLTHPYLS